MLPRIIDWSLRHRPLVLLAALAVFLGGLYAARHIPLDAIPDLSDVQVIVRTPYAGQAPQAVEDQVTYPLTTALLSVPGTTAVRGVSMFGESFVYVIFADGTDIYWARSRVTEALSQAAARLPAGAVPALGPDASGVGWVYEYALVDRTHSQDSDALRALQDFYLKYELQAVPGVAEVASLGAAARQYQVEVDPRRLAAYNLRLDDIADAVRANNLAASGAVMELGRAEYMVRADGYLKTLGDLRAVPLASGSTGRPVRLEDVARIHAGPAPRRGVTDLDGHGEVVGAIVVMRHGHNARETIARVKARLAELKPGLPTGVEIVPTYDRATLIERAVDNLAGKLVLESLVVAAVCLLFLFHLRSSLVAVLTLPIGIFAAFLVMHAQGLSANVMSLGGIAIAIGAMVDAAMVMIENMHKHLERAGPHVDRWAVTRQAAIEVGPALFFSLLVITVSFLPVLVLEGQEGKLFAPLAFTKTYAMAAAAGLAVTLVPVAMGYVIRGRVRAEQANPINRALLSAYRPALDAVLARPSRALLAAAVLLATIAWPLAKLGSEFMPPLYEGDLLYMPTTLPGVSLDEAANILQITDRLIAGLPEVERVFGKAGRADTATDPAPLSMFETTILLKPRDQWPAGQTVEGLIRQLDEAVRLPGLTNSWGYPIRTRIEMLATGIRTPLGVKVTGPELAGIAHITEQIEAAVKPLAGTRAAFAERVVGGRYLEVDVQRERAARHGVALADVQRVLAGGIGGENIDTVIDGRARYPINLRYPRALRDSPTALSASLVTTRAGVNVPLGEIAQVRVASGPAEIKSENGRLAGYVYIDTDGGDLGGYVAAAKDAIAHAVTLPPGYALAWSGQYLHWERAKARLGWASAIAFVVILLLLHLHFRHAGKVALVVLCLPFALVGGAWLVYALGYKLSVAVVVGFIALAGVAVEFGVVMLLYLDQAIDEFQRAGRLRDRADLRAAIVQGALLRVRPKIMTVAVIIGGLLPVMFSQGAGSDVMQRIAAPLVGGMITAPLLSLILIPAVYMLWLGRTLPARAADTDIADGTPVTP